MQRYFFNLVFQNHCLIDPEGVEVPDLEEAKRDALEALGESAVADGHESGRMGAIHSIQICDSDGRVLASIDAAEPLAQLEMTLRPTSPSNTWH
ncbi:MAG: DUF6894 family protein [Pseudorhizobium sp.]